MYIGLLLITITACLPGDLKAYSPNAWRRLREGMTYSQAVAVLGDPLERESTLTTLVLYYQDVPEKIDDRVVSRPQRGILIFKKNQYDGTLSRWKEPDWSRFSPPEPPSPIYQYRYITPQEGDQKRRLNQEKQAEGQQREPVDVKAKALPSQEEQIRQRRFPHDPEADMSTPKNGGRFFITAGIFFFIMALMICVAQAVKFLHFTR